MASVCCAASVPNCRTAYEPNEALLAQLELSPARHRRKEFYYGKGCDACNNTGYKGRKGIYELMKITDPVRELINERAPTVVLRQKAIELGMVTLRQDGLRSIFEGDTTIEEVLEIHLARRRTKSDCAIRDRRESRPRQLFRYLTILAAIIMPRLHLRSPRLPRPGIDRPG